MSADYVISEISIVPINPRGSLVAFASCVINSDFFIGDIGIHQKEANKISLAFPKKQLPNGATSFCFKPLNETVSDKIHGAIHEKYKTLLARFAGNGGAHVS